MKYEIDAKGKRVGRIATQAAALLMGKNTPEFERNVAPDVKVVITNASKAAIDDKKLEQKAYSRFSGYPGGLKKEAMGKLAARKGFGEIFRKAVKGMLPKNKLQAKMLKNLTVTE